MKPIKSILIADRNPRILAYLKRELSTDGYCIHTVENSRQLHHWIHKKTCDLLILDPDLLYDGDSHDLICACQMMAPRPIILHGLPADSPANWSGLKPMRFIKKSGASIEKLKEAIEESLDGEQ